MPDKSDKTGKPDDTEDLDEDDNLATRPHRKLELFEELPDDTHDDPSDFENQLTPVPEFLKGPPEPTDDDETRPHVLDDEDEVD